MFCLFCCDDKASESRRQKKQGVLVESHHDFDPASCYTATTTTRRNNDTIGSRYKGYIPWIWSKQFHHAYLLGKELGRGAYSIVHDAVKADRPESEYAVKVIARNRLNRDDLRHLHSEIRILLDLVQHDNIIQLHELYKTRQYYFVVMEKLHGGELFDRICEKEYYNEMEARNVCRTIFDAIAFCHSRHIAHRDLKPENLLLVSTENDDSKVKIADFGFATYVQRPYSLNTLLGTPAYTAPEIINYQFYDERVDNWSLGVIVYNILGGYNPFYMSTIKQTYQQIRTCNYQFDPIYWDGISPDAKNLIRSLLTIDVKQRMTAKQALTHPWMTGRDDNDDLLSKNTINLDRMKKTIADEHVARSKVAEVRSVSMYWIVSRR